MKMERNILIKSVATLTARFTLATALSLAQRVIARARRVSAKRRLMSSEQALSHTLPMKRNPVEFFTAAPLRSILLVFVISLTAITLRAQNPAPTRPYSDQVELSKVEEWVLSQGNVESIAPEIAAIFGLGSDRLPVKLKSYPMPDGVSRGFAVSTNPSQKGIVITALKIIRDNTLMYALGTAWLTDRSGTLHETILINASGAKVIPNNSRAAEFKDIKAFFLKKLKAINPTTTSSPSPKQAANEKIK